MSSLTCGSYKYVYNNKMVEFIVTTNCRVRVSFLNSVKASVRINKPVQQFFADNGVTLFIDRMCSVLGITDTSRLKIVGVYTGSAIVDFFIEEEETTTEDDATTADNTA